MTESDLYDLGTGNYQITGKLHKTDRTVNPTRVGKRRIFRDESGQLWVKCFNQWWKFPEEIEY